MTNLDKMTVVFFGDSRAADWPPPFNLPKFQFVNRGIGGETSGQAKQRCDDDLKALHPHLVIVQIGINDLTAIPLLLPQKEAIIADCKENIQQIVTRSVNLGTTVILATIFPVGKIPPEYQPFWSPDIAQAIIEVNAYIHSLKAQNVLIFDAYTILAEDGFTPDKYLQDLLHLNHSGYRLLNRELSNVLSLIAGL